jgi:predicted transcriptional regulator
MLNRNNYYLVLDEILKEINRHEKFNTDEAKRYGDCISRLQATYNITKLDCDLLIDTLVHDGMIIWYDIKKHYKITPKGIHHLIDLKGYNGVYKTKSKQYKIDIVKGLLIPAIALILSLISIYIAWRVYERQDIQTRLPTPQTIQPK